MDVAPSGYKSRAARVGIAHLPSEFELARLISGIENPHSSWNTDTSACKWEGVVCNADGEVVEIRWQKRAYVSIMPKLSGILFFEYLPHTLSVFDASNNQLTGEIPFERLRGIQTLNLSDNCYCKRLDLTSLPESMTHLNLSNNEFTGEVSLSVLPAQLYELCLSGNLLTGLPDLTALPKSMTLLSLDRNQFSGVVDLTRLPSTLRSLHLADNRDLCGSFKSSDLPKNVRHRIFAWNTDIRVIG